MRNSFMKWMLIGGLLGASAGMIVGSNPKSRSIRHKLMKNGRHLLRHSGETINDIVSIFR